MISKLGIRDFGMIVERVSEKRITVLEFLSWRSPAIAMPYCCYFNTVIFYIWPFQTKRDGITYREWERVDYRLFCDAEFIFDGKLYRAGGGTVIRRRGEWWMLHRADLVEGCAS